MKAVPALLNTNIQEFTAQFKLLRSYYSHFQIDIADGKLFPNTTVSIDDILKEIAGWSPHQTEGVTFDFDLMVTDFKTAINELEELQKLITIDIVFLHSKALKTQQLPSSEKFIIGIAIDPDDQIEDLDNRYDLKTLKALQIMTVTPGFQGSPFLYEQLIKIEQLREVGYKSLVYIDGGMNDTTIPLLLNLDYKPNILGIGSFLTKAPNLQKHIDFLHNNSIDVS